MNAVGTAILVVGMAGFAPLTTASAQTLEDVVIVYDASGSMWGQIDGVSKMEIAKEVMGDLIATWPEQANLGLMAYGHRRKADCSDIETVIAPAPLDRAAFVDAIENITPRGRTPLTESIRQAAELLSYRDSKATVILVSDGVETCQADPCALSAELAQQGVNFTAHVVGFDLTEEKHAGLACIAENTGGVFVPAKDAAGLKEALSHVQKVMDLKPVAEPEPVEPGPIDMTLEVLAQVTTGASFAVAWSSSVHPRDYVTIVPAGADEGSYTNYQRVEGNTEDRLVAPAEPGLYEVRYVLNEGKRTLASAPVEVVEAAVVLDGPAIARAKTPVRVTWSVSIHPRDYITIVPVGSKEGAYQEYIRVEEELEGELEAPAEPGLYEIRYVLQEGARTLASRALEIVGAQAPLDDGAGLTVPSQASAGETISVSWTGGSDSPDQRISLARADQADFSWINAHRVGDQTSMELTMPDEAGRYEVHYLDVTGRTVLGRAIVEVE